MSAIQLLARGKNAPNYGEGANDISGNNRGELVVAQGLPANAELTRLGQTWEVRIATGSAFTNVAGMPTTRAELALYNGDPSKVYVIEGVWFLSLTSITAIANVAIIAQLQTVAALTNDTAQLITGRTGKAYGGYAKRAVAVTTMVANSWSVLASSGNGPGTATIGQAVYADVKGGFIVRPADTFGVNAVAGTAVGTSLMGIVWHEMDLPLG